MAIVSLKLVRKTVSHGKYHPVCAYVTDSGIFYKVIILYVYQLVFHLVVAY
jgi:hypothetical protein